MAKNERNEILLESGTNEIELMEFTIGHNTFGINVAKVREILIPEPIMPMPRSHPAVEGVFKPRDVVITVINLPKYLNIPTSPDDKTLFIVTNFNMMTVAFRVHTVVGIDRISWEDIQKPEKTIYGDDDGIATGIAQFENRLITILDFEKIVSDISPKTSIVADSIDSMGIRVNDKRPIAIAEDSILLSKLIVESLTRAGYSNIKKFDDGQALWDYLQTIKDKDDMEKHISLVITDIEMPRMDGHRLLKLIKGDRHLKYLPVIVFSSLINQDMYRKGVELGADEQLSKPDIVHLVEVIDKLMNEAYGTDI